MDDPHLGSITKSLKKTNPKTMIGIIMDDLVEHG